jgi:glycine oxidase
MSNLEKVDYIIIGQGIAGSAVALQLMARGKKIVVVDQPQQNISSRIAAGLFNPITGKRMAKTWMAELIFPYLHNFYRQVEEKTAQSFFFPLPLYRPFLSIEEQNEWMAKSADPGLIEYVEKISPQSSFSHIRDEHGGLTLKHCGYLHTTHYIEAVRKLVQDTNIFKEENFEENEVCFVDGFVEYKTFIASKLILCQGAQSMQSKWFGWAPILPLKGETIRIQTEFLPQQIINRGVYLVPSGFNQLRVGATYNFQDAEPKITPAGRKELEEKLNELANFPYQVIDHEWGIRPVTPDRRPLMGMHPVHKSLIIFNGMGTKGVSLAPFFSEILVRWMEGEIDLNKDINVSRYKSLYSKLTK